MLRILYSRPEGDGTTENVAIHLYRWRYLRLRSANPLIWRALRVGYKTCLLTHLEARGQSDDDRELALVNMDNGSRGARSEKTQIEKKQ